MGSCVFLGCLVWHALRHHAHDFGSSSLVVFVEKTDVKAFKKSATVFGTATAQLNLGNMEGSSDMNGVSGSGEVPGR